MKESFREGSEHASLKNALGLLPFGQKFDDDTEPGMIEYLRYTRQRIITHPVDRLLDSAKDFFAVE